MKKVFTAGVFLTFLILPQSGWSQDEMVTPSQKTKEAVDKLRSVPRGAGKKLRALKEAAKARLGTLGRKNSRSARGEEKDAFVIPERRAKEPDISPSSVAVKRDPFRPFVLEIRPQRRDRANLSPLERYEVGQLKLVGIIWDIPVPRAMVEDTAGLGYVIKMGTPIGRNDGKVKLIRPKEVVIEEIYYDFYGAKKSREVKLKLASE